MECKEVLTDFNRFSLLVRIPLAMPLELFSNELKNAKRCCFTVNTRQQVTVGEAGGTLNCDA